MPLERIFDEEDVSELLEQNSAPPLGSRNAALIISGVCWGLTPFEQSQITTETVMAPNGEFYRIWVLPEYFSFNGEAREIHTPDHIVHFFQKYVDFLKEQNWVQSNLHSYQGLCPDKKFFRNNFGNSYELTERKGKPGSYQPRSMNDQLKKMISRTSMYGATPASFRDSYIKGLYEGGANWKDLMKASGIKQKRTLENKVRPHERDLEGVLRGLFSRVKTPDHLK